MAEARKLAFAALTPPTKGVLVVFCEEGLKIGPATRKALGPAGDLMQRAAGAEKFTGKNGSSLDIVAPAGLPVSRLVVLGAGKAGKLKAHDFVKLGGAAMGKVPSRAEQATVFAELAGGTLKPDQAAELALGTQLRGYVFDRYKTKRKEGEDAPGKPQITLAVSNPASAKRAWETSREPVADGVIMARDLINEPANVLYPEEFARRAASLKKLGVAVEVFDVPAMKKLGMHSLLGVGQGSRKDSRMVVMRWNGGKKSDLPVSFIGKGVCFDTGGLSIKPAAGG
jgi:leucyl aminopeptidase